MKWLAKVNLYWDDGLFFIFQKEDEKDQLSVSKLNN